jgi:hypothetical protein
MTKSELIALIADRKSGKAVGRTRKSLSTRCSTGCAGR